MLDRPEIGQVLSQIRSMQQEVQPQGHGSSLQQPLLNALKQNEEGASTQHAVDTSDSPSFTDMLKQAIDNVNGLQSETSDLRTRYEMGDPNVDIVDVMVASQKSSVAFEATLQARNRLVSAYQEIMRMQL
ncbi:flagellar hook-basal body complex protein FliE [Terasakiispira papahanaumokuakeensis]|uniref:Flagellar hook-basal body complex protein FliE n=1 Tax=Terasakiispira papahanaumokuakeensis TaxID=197479 RepID=A0A1E2VBE7_9GAMM|nr:flagellar hook-basal body complex protein FliE [Terasakiispira papahanaumokuakeensis]ODC04156.1 flagellar hook-basal body complex protein FliE [Terasakiispira papahanaumokuakeensis]